MSRATYPDLFAASQSGIEGAETDLNSDLASHLENLVAGLETLQFHTGPGAAVVEELKKRAGELKSITS